jgi:GT2 family glycosyltransferase
MALDVSIIVVNWNTRDVTCNCLVSVFGQTKDVRFEVILIDNASSDGSVEKIRKDFPQVTLIANDGNRGFAAANNQGMEIAKGRYVLLLNPDTIILDGAVQKTIAFADSFTDIGVVGCQVWLNDSEIQQTCFSFPSVVSLFLQETGLRKIAPRSRLLGWSNYGWWDRTSQMDVDVISGMFMLVRHEVIDKVGVMDEAYYVYAEETDWCFRVHNAGWRCVFTPIARIVHLDGGSKSTGLVRVKMFVQMQKSILIFHRKNKGVISWFFARMIYIFSMSMRFVLSIPPSVLSRDGLEAKKKALAVAALRYHVWGIEPR